VVKVPERELSAAKKRKMNAILKDLKQRMREIDELGKKIREEGRIPSPKKTRQLLEEIKVPPLKILRESG